MTTLITNWYEMLQQNRKAESQKLGKQNGCRVNLPPHIIFRQLHISVYGLLTKTTFLARSSRTRTQRLLEMLRKVAHKQLARTSLKTLLKLSSIVIDNLLENHDPPKKTKETNKKTIRFKHNSNHLQLE